MNQWLITLLTMLLFYAVNAQNPIPNFDFEDWQDLQPKNWQTSNEPGENIYNVKAVQPGTSGQYALKGEVIEKDGNVFSPILESITEDFGFPVGHAYQFFTLDLDFHAEDADDFVAVQIAFLDENMSVMGGGFAQVYDVDNGYQQISIPLLYETGRQVTRAIISITLANSRVIFPASGTYFIVDQLRLADELSTNNHDSGSLDFEMKSWINQDQLMLDINSEKEQSVAIYATDVLGRSVTLSSDTRLNPGNNQVQLDLVQAANPIFYISLVSLQTGKKTSQIILSK